jgi:hypothetical protein
MRSASGNHGIHLLDQGVQNDFQKHRILMAVAALRFIFALVIHLIKGHVITVRSLTEAVEVTFLAVPVTSEPLPVSASPSALLTLLLTPYFLHDGVVDSLADFFVMILAEYVESAVLLISLFGL